MSRARSPAPGSGGRFAVRTARQIAGWFAAAALTLLNACAPATKPLYQWEGYQRQVYEYLKGDGSSFTEQFGVMQAQAEKARATGAALPPGFRAHMGMLQLQLGQPEEARHLLEAEKLAFPESQPYMDFLLKRMGAKKS